MKAYLSAKRGERINMIPKYIDKKIDRLESLLEQAFELKSEIERWAEKKGIDTSDVEWYNNVVNDSIAVNGICKESLIEYLENND
jgi:cytidylate kinase